MNQRRKVRKGWTLKVARQKWCEKSSGSKAWTARVTLVDEECVEESSKAKRKECGRGGQKRQRLEDENRVAWGE